MVYTIVYRRCGEPAVRALVTFLYIIELMKGGGACPPGSAPVLLAKTYCTLKGYCSTLQAYNI